MLIEIVSEVDDEEEDAVEDTDDEEYSDVACNPLIRLKKSKFNFKKIN
jgi:hypothetical protein